MIIIFMGGASFFNYSEISNIIIFVILLGLACIVLHIAIFFFFRYRQDRGKFVKCHSSSYDKIKQKYEKLKELSESK